MKKWLVILMSLVMATSAYAVTETRPLGVQDLWFHTTDNGQRETATSPKGVTRYRIEGNDVLWSNRYLITIRPKNIAGDGTGSITGFTWGGSLIGTSFLGTGTPDINKYLRGDGSWAAVVATGGGDMFKSIYDSNINDIIDAGAGGTGLNTSASTGAPYLSAGTWVIQAPATFRTQIGLEIGTNVQAYNVDLSTIAGAGPWKLFNTNGDNNVVALDNGTAGQFLKWNGSAYVWDTPTGAGDMLQATYDANTNSRINTAAGGTDVNSSAATGFAYVNGGTWSFDSAATVRGNLGLGTMATQDNNNVNLTGGAINGVTIGASTPAAGTFSSLVRGAVSDTEFSYLDGITSGVQAQLDAKIAASTNLNILTSTSYPNSVWYTSNSGVFTNLGLGANNTFLKSQGASSPPVWSTVAGAGTVTGPASSTDNAIALWDGPSGTALKNSTLTFTPETGLSVPQGTSPGELRLLEGSVGGTNYVGFVAPSTRGTNLLYSLPNVDPSANGFFFLSAPSSGVSTASYGYFGAEFTNSGGTMSLATLGVGVGKLNATGTPSASTYLRGDGTWASVTADSIPSGTAPTVDAAGEVAVDTTSDQFVYYGTAKRVIHPEEQKCAVFEDLAAANDNYEIFEFRRAAVLIAVSAHCRGTCTTPATIGFEDRGGVAVTLASTLTASTGTGNSTWVNVNSGGAFVAGEGMAFDVTNAVSPETDEYTICFAYTVTAD